LFVEVSAAGLKTWRYQYPSVLRAAVPLGDATLTHFFKRLDFGVPDFSPHGTRSTAATLLREHGFSREVVELLLAHAERNKVAVEDELRVRVSDDAFVLFPGRHSAPPAARVVRLMSREQIEAVAVRRRRLIDGIELPQWPDSEHVCHGCGQRAACGAAGERLAGAVRRR